MTGIESRASARSAAAWAAARSGGARDEDVGGGGAGDAVVAGGPRPVQDHRGDLGQPAELLGDDDMLVVEDLGTVSASSGEVLLIDFGLLWFWSGEDVPVLVGDGAGLDSASAASTAVDLGIVVACGPGAGHRLVG